MTKSAAVLPGEIANCSINGYSPVRPVGVYGNPLSPWIISHRKTLEFCDSSKSTQKQFAGEQHQNNTFATNSHKEPGDYPPEAGSGEIFHARR